MMLNDLSIRPSRRPKDVGKVFAGTQQGFLFCGDFAKVVREIPDESIQLVVTSPPYFVGKEYDKSRSIDDFRKSTSEAISLIAPTINKGGSICWQVGNHVADGCVTPLDFLVFEAFKDYPEFVLRNRIVWTFGHGTHAKRRFSGRHETALWFTKNGADYLFNLDAVRVQQKYPGKRHYKGPKKGELSGNPLGKNPGDVWNIPNVKAKHIEKTAHPCQFPVALVDQLIKGLTDKNDVVFDPFAGSGTTAFASELNSRRWITADTSRKYCEIAAERIKGQRTGNGKYRSIDQPIASPNPNHRVAKKPEHFRT